MVASRLFIIVFCFLFSSSSYAQIEWFEPEVVPEKLYRANRRVLHFSGTTKPGTLIRLRDNRVKMYLDDGTHRWALLPQKNKVQFPVVADDSGNFGFNLYLPTVPVELPVEVKEKAGDPWVPYSLNFRVPDEGEADDFEALEQSYSADANKDWDYTPTVGKYDLESDRGQVLPRLGEGNAPQPYLKTDIRFFVALGGAWTNMRENAPSAPVGTFLGFHHDKSTFTFPSWAAGAIYRHSRKWRYEVNLRSTNSDYNPDGLNPLVFTDGDASWFELQLGGTYYMWRLSGKKQLGIDLGLQYHSLPYYKLREGLGTYAYFDNNVYALHAGLRLESDRDQKFPWEAYGRVLIPFGADSGFKMDSGYGFELGGHFDYELIPGVLVGGWSQVQAFYLDTEFSSVLGPHPTDYSMTVVSVGGRLTIRL